MIVAGISKDTRGRKVVYLLNGNQVEKRVDWVAKGRPRTPATVRGDG